MAWIRSNAFKKNFWCHFIWLWNGLCNSWSSVSWRIEVGALLQTLSSGKGCPGHVGASVTRYVCLGPFQVCLTIITITIIAIVTIIIAIITAIVITLITQSKERWRGGKGTATWKTRMEQHWFFPVMTFVTEKQRVISTTLRTKWTLFAARVVANTSLYTSKGCLFVFLLISVPTFLGRYIVPRDVWPGLHPQTVD